MGQAKKRGTYEERKAQAIEAREAAYAAGRERDRQTAIEREKRLASLPPEQREQIERFENRRSRRFPLALLMASTLLNR